MNSEIVPIPSRELRQAGLENLPAMIGRAGERAAWRFLEFFTASIRNKNTRAAYAQAVSDAERTWAKSIAYGLLYGKGIHTLANELCIPVVEAEALVEAFKVSMPGVTQWLDRVVAEARQQPGQPFVTTVAGRRRPLQNLLSTVRAGSLGSLACRSRTLTPPTPRLLLRRAAASWTICGPRRSARR